MRAAVTTSKTAVISGATGDIGAAIARLYASAGYSLVLLGRNTAIGSSLELELGDAGVDAVFEECDVESISAVANVVNRVSTRFGGMDVLVTAHGVLPPLRRLYDTSIEDFERTYRINCLGVFLLMKFSLPYLQERRGCIVNIASVSGLRAFPLTSAYAASKAGVIQLTRVVAQEMGTKVRANVISPGWVKTKMMDAVLSELQVTEADATRAYPFRRAATPEEIAAVALWLVSSNAEYVSGSVIPVDGGGLP